MLILLGSHERTLGYDKFNCFDVSVVHVSSLILSSFFLTGTRLLLVLEMKKKLIAKTKDISIKFSI